MTERGSSVDSGDYFLQADLLLTELAHREEGVWMVLATEWDLMREGADCVCRMRRRWSMGEDGCKVLHRCHPIRSQGLQQRVSYALSLLIT
jgi:hypothetical protein